jgi:hypothetical protein
LRDGASANAGGSGSSGLGYKDRELLPDGMKTLKLRSGDAADAKFTAKGAGSALDMPMLPLDFPVVVQLVNSDGYCWEAAFPESGIQRNDGVDLKARNE